jgi:hypothetical protein
VPCDQTREVTVVLGESTDREALTLALEGLGLTADEWRFDGRRLTFTDERRAPAAEVLARAYTKATVLNTSDRFAWAAKPQKALALAGFTRKW